MVYTVHLHAATGPCRTVCGLSCDVAGIAYTHTGADRVTCAECLDMSTPRASDNAPALPPDALAPAPKVSTWADGYGKWHAAVPLALTNVPVSTDPADVRRMMTRAARIARREIRRELDERGTSPDYCLCITRTHVTAAGVAHYREVW